MAEDNMAGMQITFGTHLPIGDLKIYFSYPEGEITGYRRALNLNEAISKVAYKVGGMLVQNHEGYVAFLPYLPDEWKDGSFKGLCIRGGAEASAARTNDIIDTASQKATSDNQFMVEIPQGKTYKVLLNGKEVNGKPDAKDLLSIEMKKNDLMEIYSCCFLGVQGFSNSLFYGIRK